MEQGGRFEEIVEVLRAGRWYDFEDPDATIYNDAADAIEELQQN